MRVFLQKKLNGSLVPACETSEALARKLTPGEAALCSILGCGKPLHSKSWCNVHYARWHRHGDPNKTVRKKARVTLCVICSAECRDSRQRYCSKKCLAVHQTGRAHPSAHGNKWAFKTTGETKWAHYKRMQKLCPPGPCVTCGAKHAVIHHKDHNPFNTVSFNLERQCRSCHAKHHHTKVAA